MTAEKSDRAFDAFKEMAPHLRGSLWWGRNDEIKERQSEFNQRDSHKGHPLLSIRKEEVSGRHDAVPMLVGTTGSSFGDHKKARCISVTGMTKDAPEHVTFFDSIVEPALFDVENMMDGVTPKAGRYSFEEKDRSKVRKHGEKALLRFTPWHGCMAMMPNWDKLVVDADEMQMIDDYCLIHLL